ncbi:MAG: hypothetical protein IIB58_09750 [Planctomycetes bacterium]|nr:hypothetical protein [Planctomycetota bacterium]
MLTTEVLAVVESYSSRCVTGWRINQPDSFSGLCCGVEFWLSALKGESAFLGWKSKGRTYMKEEVKTPWLRTPSLSDFFQGRPSN